jgi:nucleotide-binding universal stress UspA family protein
MIKRIVVAVDFSETSTRAARYAVQQMAPPLEADVVFVSVLEVSDLRVAMSHGLHGFETDDDLRRMVREWMEARFAEIESPSGAVKASRDIRRGLPDRELIEAIQEHKADLVIMGAQGIGKRNPIGSKAEYVLENSRVPLMLIR